MFISQKHNNMHFILASHHTFVKMVQITLIKAAQTQRDEATFTEILKTLYPELLVCK